MKKICFLLALLCAGAARSQNADPFINVLVNPASLQQNSNGTLQVSLANPGNSDIVANSLQVTLSAGSSAEILGIDLLNPGDDRWTIVSSTTGTNNTVVLRNNATIPGSDGGDVFFQLRATVVADSSTVSGAVAYVPGPNALLGGAASSMQGNGQTDNDQSASSLAVTPVVVLPLSLIAFTGEAVGCDVLLRWSTAKEEGMDHYEIEAGNGKGFSRLGLVKAKRDGSNSYDFRAAPPAGSTQYRLKMAGSDGSVRYSPVVVVRLDCGGTALQVFPNPASSQIGVSGLAAGDRLKLYDAGGRLLREIQSGGITETIDIVALPAGSYTLYVSGSRQEARKVSIVR